MISANGRVAYVLKRYPTLSQTFIVNEILAHEAASLQIEIYSLKPPFDTHFQEAISRVRAPVHYLSAEAAKIAHLWEAFTDAADVLPDFYSRLAMAAGEEGHYVYQAALLASRIRRQGIAHLHAHFASSATTVARLASLFADVPYTFTTHAKDIFHENVSAHDFERKLLDAAAVVTVSQYNLEFLRSTFGAAADGVICIYNGVELNGFAYRSPEDRLPRIVAVGRLVEKKGFSDLIQACALLKEWGQPFECKIIGSGEIEMGLRSQIMRLSLEGQVELVGALPQRALIPLLQEAAVMVVPSVIAANGDRDGLPTVLLEAMALGTPCVSTDLTGIPEAVHQEHTGLMVRQHDSLALARAVQQLLNNPPLRVRLAEQARKLIESQFDLHANTSRLRSLFVSQHEILFQKSRKACL